MKFIEKWEKRMAEAMDYPIKTGDLTGCIFSICVIAFGIGFLFGRIESESWYVPAFLILFLFVILVYFTYSEVYSLVKSYETKYGPSGMGTEWKRKRDERKKK